MAEKTQSSQIRIAMLRLGLLLEPALAEADQGSEQATAFRLALVFHWPLRSCVISSSTIGIVAALSAYLDHGNGVQSSIQYSRTAAVHYLVGLVYATSNPSSAR